MAHGAHLADILLIEDDTHIGDFIETELKFEGYLVRVAKDGYKGLQFAREKEPDLIILDRMLPGMDGVSLCRRLRQSSDVPILMLTAMGQVADRVEGLDSGANDYLAKPFELDEFLARVRTQLRPRKLQGRHQYSFADLTMDTKTREVFRGARSLALTPKEFDLLQYFLAHPCEVLSRQRLIEAVWQWDYSGDDNVLEAYVRYLRKKIEPPGTPRLLQTIRGVGYILRETAGLHDQA